MSHDLSSDHTIIPTVGYLVLFRSPADHPNADLIIRTLIAIAVPNYHDEYLARYFVNEWGWLTGRQVVDVATPADIERITRQYLDDTQSQSRDMSDLLPWIQPEAVVDAQA